MANCWRSDRVPRRALLMRRRRLAPAVVECWQQTTTLEESCHEATVVLCIFAADRCARLRARTAGIRGRLDERSGHADDDAEAGVRRKINRHDGIAAGAQRPSGNDNL